MLSSRLKGFTLVELLVVLAIICVLAGVLFPVFASSRAGAHRSNCLSNFKQAHMASMLYVVDYDERMMPVNHQPATPANSRNDRTWVQLTLPYLKSFSIFRCPSDYGVRPAPEATFDQDLVPGDTDSRYYTASLRSNLGYNYLYLAPIYMDGTRNWVAHPRSLSEVTDTGKTVLFVDSVWDLNDQGEPFGGGSWLVLPPCRYLMIGGRKADTFGVGGTENLYTPGSYWGWKVGAGGKAGRYGFAWPWHMGRMSIARLDGGTRAVSPKELSAGCVVRDKWAGFIDDSNDYMWDLR